MSNTTNGFKLKIYLHKDHYTLRALWNLYLKKKIVLVYVFC
jgi:hypothetical protein